MPHVFWNRYSSAGTGTADITKRSNKTVYKFYMNNKLVAGNLGNNKRQILKTSSALQLDNILCCDKNLGAPMKKSNIFIKIFFGVSYETAAKEDFSEIINEMRLRSINIEFRHWFERY